MSDISDLDPAALARAEERTGAPGFRTLDAMLAGTNADIVILATPSGLHADQAVQVAEAGRHVMTEKPMATRWQDGKRMVHACDQAGVHLFVVKQNRRNAEEPGALRHALGRHHHHREIDHFRLSRGWPMSWAWIPLTC